MHGYDIALKSPMALKAIKKRTDFMKNMFVEVSVEGFLQEDIMLGRE